MALSGWDMTGIACTDSGKTMAYVLPMIVHIAAQTELKPQEGLVGLNLVPCRELCVQVQQEVASMSEFTDISCEARA